MTRFRTALYLATVASSAIATASHAQSLLPVPEFNDTDNAYRALQGTGATAIQNVLVQSFNCNAGAEQLGLADGRLTTVPEPTNLPGTAGMTPPNQHNCAAFDVQPNFKARYVATGSGFGRQSWRTFSNQFTATPASGAPPYSGGTYNAFDRNTDVGFPNVWPHVQFAFSESAVSSTDLTAYNTNAAPSAGPAIQIPLYVLPVAFAYNPIYGTNSGGQPMRFNIASPQSINSVTVGGMRLTRDLYCKVWNGSITNFNDAAFTAANGGTALFDPTNDTSTRWTAATTGGVPIRIVGRLDRSGTTDIFTRALSSQCNGITGLTNKFAVNSDALPYNPTSGVDLSAELPATAYRVTGGGANAGGTTPINAIGKEYWNPAGGPVVGGVATGAIAVSALSTGGAPTSQPSTNVGSGRFLVANGSTNVVAAINGQNADPITGAGVSRPDYALGGVTLNGKIGYVAGDFINNASQTTLHAAALQRNGTGTVFLVPSATNATAAFGSVLPPQSDNLGNWFTGDTRPQLRSDPLGWYSVLYPTATTGLATPALGYPVTGSSQFLGYTCYEGGNRAQMVKFVAENLGLISQTSAGAAIDPLFIRGTGTPPGLLARANIGALPTSWRTAVEQTFLRKSTQVDISSSAILGNQNLWIQTVPFNGLPNTTANVAAGTTAKCDGKIGA